MNKYVISLLLVSVFLTVLQVWLFFRYGKCEGFADSGSAGPMDISYSATFGRLFGIIRRLSGVLKNPAEWKDRYEMMHLTPVELARRHIQKTSAVPI